MDISTNAALREMVLPALLPMVAVIVTGLLLGAKALAALVAGAIITAFMLAVTMANAGCVFSLPPSLLCYVWYVLTRCVVQWCMG